MKILLCHDVEGLGWLGDVVEVADGYARNYLIPQRIGVAPSEAAVKSLADEKAKRAEQRIADTKRLEEAASAVDGAEAVIAAKANEQGHLFGSVSASAIASNLREQGFTVADGIVRIFEHIKEVGTHTVELKFTQDLVVAVNVVVVAEGGDDAAVSESEKDETSEATEEDK
ncbi:MAG: 50S ribosomal protein L9 [Planctomycetes bacterium]|nr:50S ribosomal protein L9 [Planctomycetota bacterium]